MVRRLREKQPKVIYLELCEDLRPLLTELRNCRLPVAVQAFASELDGFPPDWAPLQRGRADHRGVGRVPGHRLRAGHARASSWCSSTGRPTTSSSGSRATGRRRAEPTPATPSRAPTPRTPPARRRGRRGDRRPAARASPSWRSTCCTTAGCGTGRSGGTSTSSSRSADADYDTYRQVHGPDRQPVPAAGARRRPPDDASTRTASATCGPGCASTSPRPASTAADCLYVCGAFHAASRVARVRRRDGTRRRSTITAAHRHDVAATG